MNERFKFLKKQDLLENMYISTNKKFPHKNPQPQASTYIYDFYEYSGIFYYSKDNTRFDIDGEAMSFFDLTLDEMIDAVNANTIDDFILHPIKLGIYELFDRNGDKVDRIILNNDKLSHYLRVLDDGFGIYLYPAKYNLWYVSIGVAPESEEIFKNDFATIKELYGKDIPFFFKITSDGDIQTLKAIENTI